jgi:CobQ-like glutamine amidotransferase family enzyme
VTASAQATGTPAIRALTILALYPEQLGINGDSGNVLALVERARWRGVEVTVAEHNVGDALPDSVDLIHIGSGPRTAQQAVRDDLALIAPRLREWKLAGVPVLAIAGGWQLLGSSLVEEDGTTVDGAGLFDVSTRLVGARAVGEIVVRTADGTVAGFENHGAVVTLGAGARPLGTVTAGYGNGGVASSDARIEGVIDGDSVGTNLHGPFLPMNPAWADRMLRAALALRGLDSTLADDERVARVDAAAEQARAAIAKRVGV